MNWNFPFRKWSLFESLERSDDRQRMDPASMRTIYLDNVAAHLRAVREAAGKLNISHVLLEHQQARLMTRLTAYIVGEDGRNEPRIWFHCRASALPPKLHEFVTGVGKPRPTFATPQNHGVAASVPLMPALLVGLRSGSRIPITPFTCCTAFSRPSPYAGGPCSSCGCRRCR